MVGNVKEMAHLCLTFKSNLQALFYLLICPFFTFSGCLRRCFSFTYKTIVGKQMTSIKFKTMSAEKKKKKRQIQIHIVYMKSKSVCSVQACTLKARKV